MKLSCWLNQFEQREFKDERLGQRFCNMYIRCSWPDLYYEEDEAKALALITQYLIQLHYYPNVPHNTGDVF